MFLWFTKVYVIHERTFRFGTQNKQVDNDTLPTFSECDGYIKSKYPLSGKKIKNNQQFIVTVNGKPWIQTYIKMTSLSSLIRSTSPSGYKVCWQCVRLCVAETI